MRAEPHMNGSPGYPHGRSLASESTTALVCTKLPRTTQFLSTLLNKYVAPTHVAARAGGGWRKTSAWQFNHIDDAGLSRLVAIPFSL